jgi:acetyl-CoA synthetase
MADSASNISSMLQEHRVFPPKPASASGFERWHIGSLDEYRRLHVRSIAEPDAFWGEEARRLDWFKPWDRVLEWHAPDARWFVGGEINACYNCVDRHVQAGFGDQTAIVWEGEPVHGAWPGGDRGEPEIKRLTYRELLRETIRCANALRTMGVKKGDVVTIYMPMVPELAVAMLACVRIGAAHSVIFGGFAPTAISERAIDAKSRVIITADGGYRRGEVVPLLKNVQEAVGLSANQGHVINHVMVLRRISSEGGIGFDAARMSAVSATKYHEWHKTLDSVSEACPCERTQSEDMLFLLYTSGSTGKPKGIVHTTGGYLAFVQMTARLTFNLIPDAGQMYWCSADIGWITGHSYVLYGLLMNRVPTLMYEGAPNFPAVPGAAAGAGDRFWRIIARHKVTQFYTAPTAIRTFMKWGDDLPAKHDLSSLRILGTVGEPINPEAWIWYHTHIGREKCPIVDTYWQTETGGHVVTPLPGATPTKPGSCTLPMLGIDAAIVNEAGEELGANQGGLFVIRKPWPGMLRGVFGNRERFVSNYWGRVFEPGAEPRRPFYFSADGARRDADGYFWVQGRIDDVIKVSGHLLGTMEVESALVSHPAVAEGAVVGVPHEIKGSAICAFVTLRPAWLIKHARQPDDALKKELGAHVAKEVGALARPDQIRFADGLPKTRSGKIMRRLLRDVACGVEKITQDTTTLEDFTVVAKLRGHEE